MPCKTIQGTTSQAANIHSANVGIPIITKTRLISLANVKILGNFSKYLDRILAEKLLNKGTQSKFKRNLTLVRIKNEL